ncbi:DUF58 domain-containing protein [Falsirhodobacter sp. alg1]|uniref:DUF58 domain-containing protein n=1 Tax=Falsirhodobacter sp. alg1 TaxID=1472418 RepID=UPI000787D959|nr:DUF58 domain-containing protein [Falsirhodobacter sp. alg1]
MSLSGPLRPRAEALGRALPPLLAGAEQMAHTVMLGEHGRRRAGTGDEFWQYRPAQPGDPVRLMDWRRSARSDTHYVREREWQAAQTVAIWVDNGASMEFSGDASRSSKSDRARLLALALGILLLRGGERVGFGTLPPRPGRSQILRLAMAMEDTAVAAEHGPPDLGHLPRHGRAVLVSDMLGPIEPLRAALTRASELNARGVLLQVLDPAEEVFPYDGRTIFTSMGGGTQMETLRAGGLREQYITRLAERRAELAALARASGWQFHSHSTGDMPQSALLWLYRALERGV